METESRYSSRDTLIISLGVVILVFGLLAGLMGLGGLNAVNGSGGSPYLALAEAFGGGILVIFGSEMLLTRGGFSKRKGVSLGLIIVLVFAVLFMFGLTGFIR